MTSTATQDQIALIGAGPSGLAGARNLHKQGLAFQGFEAHADVGGLWNIENPRSTVYASAHLISSKRMTEFHEFPMAEQVADYPSHSALLDYFRAFAHQFDLYRHYRFNTRVLQVEPVSQAPDTHWRLTTQTGDAAPEVAEYKGVVIANGTLAEAHMPAFAGQFAGALWHSSAYKQATQFKGQRVLIVGAGNSGCDIAVDAVHHADSIDISVRRGYYFVPKYVFGQPADTMGGRITLPPRLKQAVDSTVLQWFTGDPVRFGFPRPHYRMYESHPVVNSLILYHIGHGDVGVRADIERLNGHTVHFRDGTARDYDLILAATGYKLHYPFLDHALLNWQGMAPQLYLNIFAPRFDRLAVLGMVEASGLGWQGRYEQADLVARYFKALDSASPQAAALQAAKQGSPANWPDMSGGYRYLQLERMAYYVHKDTYRKAVRAAAQAFA